MVLSDEELLYLTICGYEYALQELYSIYYHMAWKIVRDMIGKDGYQIDVDDLILDVMVCFMELIYQYRSDKNASFRTYIKICLRNRIYTALRKQYRIFHKNAIVLSLDDMMEDGHKIGDYFFPVPQEEQPDFIMRIEEDAKEYHNYSRKVLTSKEKMVFDYLNIGYDAKDVAKILGISLKSCYNTAYRATKKMRGYKYRLTRQKKCVKLK